MRVLVTGAAGFVGSKLVSSLSAERFIRISGRGTDAARIDEIVAHDILKPSVQEDGPRIISRAGDLSNRAEAEEVVGDGLDLVVHLAAVVSGQAEEDFDLGYHVNLDGTRNLLEACRRLAKPPVFIFASSGAAYGGELPETVPDNLRLTPTTSYGAQKVIGELLVTDYSRKGFIDGRALRFPTIVVRPGAPNRALSSYASSIIREPLQGKEAICPVDDGVQIFILSPRMLIRNIRHAIGIPASELGFDRALTLPGIRVSAGQMIGALRQIAGDDVVARIVRRPDPQVAKVVEGWPGYIEATRARSLGFVADNSMADIITAFIQDELGGA